MTSHHTTKPLAIQLYSIRDEIAADRRASLDRLADIGFGAVEAFRPTDDPGGFRRLADDLGLAVCAAHAVDLVRDGDPAEVFDAVQVLGTDAVIVPGGIPKERFVSLDGLEEIADLLNRLAEQARDRGLRFGYHNHDHELAAMVEGRHALDVLAELLHPDVFFEVDTYWAAVGGADVPALLDRLGDRVHLLHVKDGPGVGDEPNTAVGTGSMPVPEFLAAAPEAWRVVEFDACDTEIFAAIEASYDYLVAQEAP